jgi:hypothetical protein
MSDPMKVTESRLLIETAQRKLEFSQEMIADFLQTELSLASTFAELALDSFSAGHTDTATRTAAAAKQAYSTVQKFLPKLMVQEREPIEAKLASLDALMERLDTINSH